MLRFRIRSVDAGKDKNVVNYILLIHHGIIRLRFILHSGVKELQK